MMTVKEALHQLVDELPDSELLPARRFLEYLRQIGSDRVLRALLEAPADDEPLTAEDCAALDEAWQEFRRGEGIPDEQLKL
jgi:hypothetical protein